MVACHWKWYNVWVDGACIFNGRPDARAGIGVHFSHDPSLDVSERIGGRATNSRAEITAVTRAVEIALNEGIQKLCIITDSEYVIKCDTEWTAKWRKNGWQRCNGGPVVNRSDLELMQRTLGRLQQYKWKHVYGHTGDPGNQIADQLANKAARSGF